jgi:hypothetical protein
MTLSHMSYLMKLILKKWEEVRNKGEKISFENDFFTYLAAKDLETYSEAIFSSDSLFWNETNKVKIDSLLQN